MKPVENWTDGHIVRLSNRQATVTHDLLLKETRRLFRKYCIDNQVEDIETAYIIWSADLHPISWEYNIWKSLWEFYDGYDPGYWIKENLMRYVK